MWKTASTKSLNFFLQFILAVPSSTAFLQKYLFNKVSRYCELHGNLETTFLKHSGTTICTQRLLRSANNSHPKAEVDLEPIRTSKMELFYENN